MTTKIFPSPLPFLLLIQIRSSKSDDIAVYWDQDSNVGSLKETCATGKYSIVVVGYLRRFWNGETPIYNLGGHCDPSSYGCSASGTEIKYCQQQGIKMMLSLGALSANYSLSSSDDAQKVFDYLWNDFLGGSSSSQRPFGDAILDGIDFNIRESAPHLDDLARYLKSHSTDSQKLYLSAAPECPFPDAYLCTAQYIT